MTAPPRCVWGVSLFLLMQHIKGVKNKQEKLRRTVLAHVASFQVKTKRCSWLTMGKQDTVQHMFFDNALL